MQLSHESTLGGYIKPDTAEEKLYGSYFLKESWHLDQFAPLMFGLTPERFKYLHEHPAEAYASEDLSAVLAANKMIKTFLEGVENLESYELPEDNPYITKWKFLKWAAQRQIIFEDKFLNYLSLSEIEICLEFLPIHHDLTKNPPHSHKYHKAYYLKQARELEHRLGHSLTPTEIYHHPHMQNVQRTIRDYGGITKKGRLQSLGLKNSELYHVGGLKKYSLSEKSTNSKKIQVLKILKMNKIQNPPFFSLYEKIQP